MKDFIPDEFLMKLEGLWYVSGSYLETLDRKRPYNGQSHTSHGERGKREVHGITMRDVHDAFIRACFHASDLSAEKYPVTIYDLPWDDVDPVAIAQNLTCEIEKMMGIYPNLPTREARNAKDND